MDEIQKTQEIIDRITGYTPILFRPPYGMQNRTILHISKLAAIQWSLDSEDWKLPSSGAMVQHIMKNVHT
ncbi:MAG: polysaccharide deacetylase family protein [bacterium]